MPLNRSQLIRITTIDRCLCNHHRRWTLEDLIDACSDALYEFEGRDEPVSRRTVQNDLALMRSEKLGYNAPIVVKDRKYYTYEDPDYSIRNTPLSEDDILTLREAMDVLKHFQMFSQFSSMSSIVSRLEDQIYVEARHRTPAIDLERNERLKGLEYISEIYAAILSKEPLRIGYKSFKSRKDAPTEMIVSPYLLKEWRNRWFVVCYYGKIKDDVTLLALDRIHSITHDRTLEYVPNTFFDPAHYFDDVVGVTRSLKSRKEEVVLWFDSSQAPYILTKPIHSSQKVLGSDRSHGVTVSIEVIPNRELERDILGYGKHCRVISPESIRRNLAEHFRKGALLYEDVE